MCRHCLQRFRIRIYPSCACACTLLCSYLASYCLKEKVTLFISHNCFSVQMLQLPVRLLLCLLLSASCSISVMLGVLSSPVMLDCTGCSVWLCKIIIRSSRSYRIRLPESNVSDCGCLGYSPSFQKRKIKVRSFPYSPLNAFSMSIREHSTGDTARATLISVHHTCYALSLAVVCLLRAIHTGSASRMSFSLYAPANANHTDGR